ncbi:hypothetical protein GCM10027073_34160 [Streptomyces chlorus]
MDSGRGGPRGGTSGAAVSLRVTPGTRGTIKVGNTGETRMWWDDPSARPPPEEATRRGRDWRLTGKDGEAEDG